MPVAAAPARRRHPMSVGWWPVLFIGPLLAGVAVFYYYPIVANAWTSLTSSNAFGQNPEFVGVDNYAEVFASGELGSALGNTVRSRAARECYRSLSAGLLHVVGFLGAAMPSLVAPTRSTRRL